MQFSCFRFLRSLFVDSLSYDIFLPPANKVCEGYVFTGVCLSTGGGHAWQGACISGTCVAGGHGLGVCTAGMHTCKGGGHAWQAMHACTPPPGRYYEIWSMRGRYASYWNAFLFTLNFSSQHIRLLK